MKIKNALSLSISLSQTVLEIQRSRYIFKQNKAHGVEESTCRARDSLENNNQKKIIYIALHEANTLEFRNQSNNYCWIKTDTQHKLLRLI